MNVYQRPWLRDAESISFKRITFYKPQWATSRVVFSQLFQCTLLAQIGEPELRHSCIRSFGTEWFPDFVRGRMEFTLMSIACTLARNQDGASHRWMLSKPPPTKVKKKPGKN
jgi:hypothetical protein